MFQEDDGAQLFYDLSEEDFFWERFIKHDEFIDVLLNRVSVENQQRNVSLLYYLLIEESHSNRTVFTRLCNDPQFYNKLIHHPEFITTLLARCDDSLREIENNSVLNNLTDTEQGCILLKKFCTDPVFLEQLKNHPDLKNALTLEPIDKNAGILNSALTMLSGCNAGIDVLNLLNIQPISKVESLITDNRYHTFSRSTSQETIEEVEPMPLNNLSN